MEPNRSREVTYGPVAAAKPSVVAEEGIVVTDMSFRPIAIDRGAAAILNDSNGRADHALGLPAEILAALRKLAPAGASAVRASFRKGNSRYSCRAYFVEPRDSVLKQPVMALFLQKDISIDDAVSRVAAEYALTEREQEAVRGISMGLSSKELAARMKISPNTVKAFLRMIMIKMGVTTRAGIVAKILDHMEGDS
jgi:DNA-binding CsgD family transcriptional regulator